MRQTETISWVFWLELRLEAIASHPSVKHKLLSILQIFVPRHDRLENCLPLFDCVVELRKSDCTSGDFTVRKPTTFDYKNPLCPRVRYERSNGHRYASPRWSDRVRTWPTYERERGDGGHGGQRPHVAGRLLHSPCRSAGWHENDN